MVQQQSSTVATMTVTDCQWSAQLNETVDPMPGRVAFFGPTGTTILAPSCHPAGRKARQKSEEARIEKGLGEMPSP